MAALFCRDAEMVTIHPADVVLLEGILVLYDPQIRELMHMKLFVDTDSDTRLARRGKQPIGHDCSTDSGHSVERYSRNGKRLRSSSEPIHQFCEASI